MTGIIELPYDILKIISSYLDNHKHMFMFIILSNKNSDEYNNLLEKGSPFVDLKGNRIKWDMTNISPRINLIHNCITYVQMSTELLWGSNIPTHNQFAKIIKSNKSDNVSISQQLKDRFQIIHEIINYLERSPNVKGKDIIWNREKIGSKLIYSKDVVHNKFWDEPLSNLKHTKYTRCGCTHFCWRCRKECDIFNVKHGDKLVVKSHENKRFYICSIKMVKYGNKYFQSVRDVYIKESKNIINWETIWMKNICPRIEISVEFLPLPYEKVPNKKIQFMFGNEKFYYMAECYSSIMSWGYNKPYQPWRTCLNPIYGIPLGWLFTAEKEAKTALALI